MDDLRTRIAAALLGDHCVQGMTAPCDDCRAHALRQADAVIRELDSYGWLIDPESGKRNPPDSARAYD